MASSELKVSRQAPVVESSGMPTGHHRRNIDKWKTLDLAVRVGGTDRFSAMGSVYAFVSLRTIDAGARSCSEEVAANATASRFARNGDPRLEAPAHRPLLRRDMRGRPMVLCMELIEGGRWGLLSEQGNSRGRSSSSARVPPEYAHERYVIHRDLKPGNLLLTRNGKVKLADFGLALVAAETRLTSTGKTMGSLHYMSPEQIQGKPPLSSRSDLYALGCVLFELLVGRTPFVGQAMAEVLQQHIRQPPPAISSFAIECPAELETLIAQLLQKNPVERPQTAQPVAVPAGHRD